jgi:hypothetical protein
MFRLSCGFSLCVLVAARATSNGTVCAELASCGECVSEGCGWCSWCPYCPGHCMGQASGPFTCTEIFTNIPGSLCHSGTDDPTQSSLSYDCDRNTGQCVAVPPFIVPEYQTLSSCINDCRPENVSRPLYVCNATLGQCSQTASNATGTTKELCESQCLLQSTCDGGTCTNKGVDGPNAPTCPSDGCPQPLPGPDCRALSSRGCSACVAEVDRCGWCPSNNTCAPVGKNVELYFCPPGFTTNSNSCPASLGGTGPTLLSV